MFFPEWYRPNENNGFCHCGCGQKVAISARNLRRDGYVKGQPIRFVKGHMRPVIAYEREESPAWKGGRRVSSEGYVLVYAPDHPKTGYTGYVREHRLVMERVYGRMLDRTEEVHHLNGDKTDNRVVNLEVLPRSFHRRITNAKPIVSPEGFEWKVCW